MCTPTCIRHADCFDLTCFPSEIHVSSHMGSAHYGQIPSWNRNIEVLVLYLLHVHDLGMYTT